MKKLLAVGMASYVALMMLSCVCANASQEESTTTAIIGDREGETQGETQTILRSDASTGHGGVELIECVEFDTLPQQITTDQEVRFVFRFKEKDDYRTNLYLVSDLIDTDCIDTAPIRIKVNVSGKSAYITGYRIGTNEYMVENPIRNQYSEALFIYTTFRELLDGCEFEVRAKFPVVCGYCGIDVMTDFYINDYVFVPIYQIGIIKMNVK